MARQFKNLPVHVCIAPHVSHVTLYGTKGEKFQHLLSFYYQGSLTTQQRLLVLAWAHSYAAGLL